MKGYSHVSQTHSRIKKFSEFTEFKKKIRLKSKKKILNKKLNQSVVKVACYSTKISGGRSSKLLVWKIHGSECKTSRNQLVSLDFKSSATAA
jgi:hypothetical protein